MLGRSVQFLEQDCCVNVRGRAVVFGDALVDDVPDKGMHERKWRLRPKKVGSGEGGGSRCDIAPFEPGERGCVVSARAVTEHRDSARERGSGVRKPSKSKANRPCHCVRRQPLNHGDAGCDRRDILGGETPQKLAEEQRVSTRRAVTCRDERLVRVSAQLGAHK
ncbi:MAG TPA: hypothetical protein VLJ38_10935, partial [Polyangiaceae bacterium]|nr:hypothetical protein [Polyangiaceae bacterium]